LEGEGGKFGTNKEKATNQNKEVQTEANRWRDNIIKTFLHDLLEKRVVVNPKGFGQIAPWSCTKYDT